MCNISHGWAVYCAYIRPETEVRGSLWSVYPEPHSVLGCTCIYAQYTPTNRDSCNTYTMMLTSSHTTWQLLALSNLAPPRWLSSTTLA